MILAAIDIGSNASRLLIAEVTENEKAQVQFTKLNFLRLPLRLGFDVFQSGKISDEKKQMIKDTMNVYRILMDIYKVEAYRACATSAMRDAANGASIVEAIRKETGIALEIISGAEEAAIIYETHIADMMDKNGHYLYVDVGGGSTELSMFGEGQIVFKESFNIGTIRLLQQQVSTAQMDYLEWFVKHHTKAYQDITIIGSGGNINKLFSMSKTKEGRPLSLEQLDSFYEQLASLSVEERMRQFGIRRDRADVIVPALCLYTSVIKWAGAKEIFVPKIGLADGLIKLLYQQRKSGIGTSAWT